MKIKKALLDLRKKAREDYDEIKSSVSLILPDIEGDCLKIVIANSFIEYIETDLEETPVEMFTLLFHEKPVSLFYDWYMENDIDLLEYEFEVISRFTLSARKNIEKIALNPENHSKEIAERAVYFHSLISEAMKPYEIV